MKLHQSIAVTLTVWIVLSSAAFSQGFPNKPVKLVVPYASGGATDILARALANKLKDRIGQSVVIENRPGATTVVGTDYVTKSPADGYTMLITSTALTIVPSINPKVQFAISDLAPVVQLVNMVYVVVAAADFPAKNISELIAYAKANPDKVSFGGAGTGTADHLAMELLKSRAGIQMTHIPYKGTAPMFQDVLGGRVPLATSTMIDAGLHLGKIRLLATMTPTRSPLLPDVPTVAEAGLPGFEAVPWFGIFVPKGTPREVIARLHREYSEVQKDAEILDMYKKQALTPASISTEAFAEVIRKDTEKWSLIVKQLGLKVEE